jgi:catechol 2,3-dioxygenase-like lactoylglutathione lyase family enzyme
LPKGQCPPAEINPGGVRVSLENFRKQAKLLVRWHRERNYSVGGRIRQLSRYQELTDAQALALPFPLSEAQEVIALENGYASWAELKEGLKSDSGTAPPASAAPRLTKGIPVVFVSDVPRAAGFYRDQLGFTIDFLHGQPAFYASVSRDEASIHLRFVHEPAFVPAVRDQEQLLSAFVAVANVKGLFVEYESRNVPFVHRLRKEPWGQSSFIVRDPDGNWLCFAG